MNRVELERRVQVSYNLRLAKVAYYAALEEAKRVLGKQEALRLNKSLTSGLKRGGKRYEEDEGEEQDES